MLGTSFTEDDFSLDVGRGEFGRIQAHDIYCALYLYYYYISSTLDHQALDPRSWEPLTYRNLHWHAQWLTLAVGENNWGCWLKCDFLQWGQLKESDFLAGSSDLQKQRSQWPGRNFAAFYDLGHFCWLYSMGLRLHKHTQIQGQGTQSHISVVATRVTWQRRHYGNKLGKVQPPICIILQSLNFSVWKYRVFYRTGASKLWSTVYLGHQSFIEIQMFHLSRASQMALVLKNLPANVGDIRDMSSIPGSRRSPGGEHVNPLQCSCLKNPMDREPDGLQSIGLQSRTQLKWLSIHAYSS